jgi:hypothetical protein
VVTKTGVKMLGFRMRKMRRLGFKVLRIPAMLWIRIQILEDPKLFRIGA